MHRFDVKNRLAVRTKSGHRLGKVSAVQVDQATGKVATFFVAADNVIKGLLGQELSVSWSQVVDWQEDELVVADGTVPGGATAVAFAAPSAPQASLSDRA